MSLLKKGLGVYRHWRYGGAPAVSRFLEEFKCNHVHVLSTRPPVIYMHWGRPDDELHDELHNEPLMVLYLFPWCADLAEVPDIEQKVKSALRKHPKHRIVFLCNEEFIVEPLRAAGVEALFVNQNAFINENIFSPQPVEKKYDAVYSASMAPYKRHLLAKDIKSLMLLAYSYSGTTKEDYQREVRTGLAHAFWAKDTRNCDKVPTERMVEFYSSCHVGLCLSAVEGGMFVSMEYLMCGLPIVTTRSRGGREVFWSDEYVIVADDNSKAIADAVQEMKGRKLRPERVREAAFAKVHEHRQRLQEFLGKIGAGYTVPWKPGSQGILNYANLRELGRKIREGVEPGQLP